MSAIHKINNFSSTVKSLQAVFWIKNLPVQFFQLSIIGVIILLITAPIVMVYSVFNKSFINYAKLCCYALIVFTILATLLYHFPTDPSERINFMKNTGIIGGFLALSELF
jgi:uncharacterized membrane protein YphA (DoxX/SURF4 family)